MLNSAPLSKDSLEKVKPSHTPFSLPQRQKRLDRRVVDSMKEESSPKDALAINLWVLRITGAWVLDISDPKLRLLYNLYGTVIMSLMTLAYFLTEVIYVTTIWGDIQAIIEVLFLLLTHVGNAAKLVNTLMRRKRIEKLVTDSYQAKFLPRNVHHRKFLTSTIRLAHRDNILICLMCSSTIMAWAIVPLLEKTEEWRLPLKGWFPFDTNTSPIFQIIYVYQILAVEMNACMNAMMDTFASVFMALAGTQLDMLRRDLADLTGKENKGTLVPEEFPSTDGDILHAHIVRCIEHHDAIIKFAHEIQDVFGIGILVQFAVSSTILCLTCFKLTLISPASLQFYSLLLYQGCMLFQIYCYCWYGNGIIVKTSELMTAAFHCQWTSCSARFKSTLRIMMCRMQRPMQLMVGEIFGLSLQTFSMILRSAYSFYAVVQRVHTEDN